ncbi:MAG: flagellar hook-basal body complex protein, partial [Desulfobacteraceae bacterium]
MIASLYAGISGLSANATAMTVIGDNIANVNTTAFKGNRSHFANILSTSLGGQSATGNVGRGVEFWGVNAQWTQGSIENSSSATDLAINGKGFFIVQDGTGSDFYTRAGNFQFDKNGYLVNPDGMQLQGYQIDSAGNLGAIASVYIPGER